QLHCSLRVICEDAIQSSRRTSSGAGQLGNFADRKFLCAVLRPHQVPCCRARDHAFSIRPRRSARSRRTSWGTVMVGTERHNETASRGARMLRTALGPAIASFLQDASVVEVMLNPDGRLWIDRLKGGLEDTGERLSPADGERIVRLVAHHVGAEVHPAAPRVSAELPETGERFEGLIPPVVAAPTFAIRKLAVAVFTLDDYVASGIMKRGQAEMLRLAVERRRN